MNEIIDLCATGDGKMKILYARYYKRIIDKKTISLNITKSWLSMVYRFKNFTKQDKDRIENFFTELKAINDYGANNL